MKHGALTLLFLGFFSMMRASSLPDIAIAGAVCLLGAAYSAQLADEMCGGTARKRERALAALLGATPAAVVALQEHAFPTLLLVYGAVSTVDHGERYAIQHVPRTEEERTLQAQQYLKRQHVHNVARGLGAVLALRCCATPMKDLSDMPMAFGIVLLGAVVGRIGVPTLLEQVLKKRCPYPRGISCPHTT